MNATRIRCLLVLLAPAIVGFGPISMTGLIGMYVVVRRPAWFGKVVDELYAGSTAGTFGSSPGAPARRGFGCSADPLLIALMLLMMLDIAPVPVIGAIGLYVVIARPGRFRRLVGDIYRGSGVQRK
jgi:hypothetical protein